MAKTSKKSKTSKTATTVETGVAAPGTNSVPVSQPWSMATSKNKPKPFKLSLKGKFGYLLEGGLSEVMDLPLSNSKVLTSPGVFFTRDMLRLMYSDEQALTLDRKDKDRVGPLPDAMWLSARELEAAGVGTVMYGVLTQVVVPDEELVTRLVAEETNTPYVDLLAVPRDLEVSKKEFLSLPVEDLIRLSVRRRVRNSTRYSYKSKAGFLKQLVEEQPPIPVPATAEQTRKFLDLMHVVTSRFVMKASQFLDEHVESLPKEKSCSHCGGTGKILMLNPR